MGTLLYAKGIFIINDSMEGNAVPIPYAEFDDLWPVYSYVYIPVWNDKLDPAVRRIMGCLETGTSRSVAILGLAYKTNTPVIEQSAGVKIIEELLREDVEIIAYDPIALDNARGRFGDNIMYSSSVRECFNQSSLCVITTTADHFRGISADDIVHDPTTIIDCWRMLDPSRLGDKVRYVALGRNAPWPR